MNRPKMPILDVKKYGGKQVAIIGGKVIASGMTTQDVLEKAKLIVPKATWRDILVVGVPKGVAVVWLI